MVGLWPCAGEGAAGTQNLRCAGVWGCPLVASAHVAPGGTLQASSQAAPWSVSQETSHRPPGASPLSLPASPQHPCKCGLLLLLPEQAPSSLSLSFFLCRLAWGALRVMEGGSREQRARSQHTPARHPAPRMPCAHSPPAKCTPSWRPVHAASCKSRHLGCHAGQGRTGDEGNQRRPRWEGVSGGGIKGEGAGRKREGGGGSHTYSLTVPSCC